VRHHPEAPGHVGQAAAEPMSGQHQVDNEDPLLNESELDDGEASVLPASRSSQAAPTVTTGGVVGTLLQHVCSNLRRELNRFKKRVWCTREADRCKLSSINEFNTVYRTIELSFCASN
jgi:hypothetical protein